MANAEDVVLYDLNGEAGPEELIAMMSEPENRWFARPRLAALAQRGLVAAVFDPKLHPRGHDGKFINVFGWVRWLGGMGKWNRGQVTSIDSDGTINVRLSNGEKGSFDNANKLYTLPTPKAHLHLPDPLNKDNDPLMQGFDKVGGQGGSNPGGLYQVSGEKHDLFKDSSSLSNTALEEIAKRHNLTFPQGDVQSAIGQDGDGRVAYIGDAYYGVDGEKLPSFDSVFLYSGDWKDVQAAWGEVIATANLLSTGDKVYIKHAKSKDHAASEVLANRLYEMAGVNVAETIMGDDGITIGSKLVPTHTSKIDVGGALNDPEVMARVRADFAIDAWLANWDVAGLGLENTQIVDGYPYRIDAGGALLYRAQGSPKGAAFGPVVGELETLRSAAMNPAAAKVFKDVTDKEITAGIERIAAISPQQISAAIDDSGIDLALAKTIEDTLIARRKYMLDLYGVEDPWLKDDNSNYVLEPEVEAIISEEEKIAVEPAQQPHLDKFGYPLEVGSEVTWLNAALAPQHGTVKELLPSGTILITKDDGILAHKNPNMVVLAQPQEVAPEALTEPAALTSLWSVHKHGWQETGAAAFADNMEAIYEANVNGVYDTSFEDITAKNLQYVALDTEELFVSVDGQTWQITTITPGTSGVLLIGDDAFGTRGFLSLDNNETVRAYVGPKGTLNYTGKIQSSELGYAGAEISKALAGDPDLNTILKQGIGPGAASAIATTSASAPQFKSSIAFLKPVDADRGAYSINSSVAAVGDYVKLENGSLYRVSEVDHTTSSPDPVITLVDPFTGEPPVGDAFGFGDVAWHVRDGYSKEFLDAYVSKQGGSLDNLYEPTNVDESVIAVLDAESDGGTVTLEEAPAVEIPLEVDPVAGSVNHNIDGVHPSLAVGAPFQLTDLNDESAAALVGKMMYMVRADLIPEGEDTVELGGGSGISFATVYVEKFELQDKANYVHSTRLTVRLPNGSTSYLSIPSADYKPTGNQGTYRVIENMTADVLKVSGAPTLKTDGTIVHNGKVVGTWGKDGYYGPTKFSLNADSTLIGKTINGANYSKNDARKRIHAMLLPTAPPVKVKKGSAAAKKIKDAAEVATTPSLSNATYSNGEKASLGDWVGYTKGGGGFVGKIVGWPNEEKDPDVVFLVSTEGVQKAVNLKGSVKKVSAPSDTGPNDNTIPNAYIGFELGDGTVPSVGQKVAAGKPGETKIEGYITNINPKQGMIYIQTPDGKNVNKKASVVTLVEPKQLWWDASDPAIASVLSTEVKPKKGKKKVAGINYPGPDGATIPHKAEAEQEWLAGNPKRKLTKDGYVPEVGMRVRNKAGDELVVLSTSGEWETNPNRVRTWNLTQKKIASTSTTSIEVDHAAMLTAYDGEAVQKVSSIATFTPGNFANSAPEGGVFPDGSVIWRVATLKSVWNYQQQKNRIFKDWRFVVVAPNGQAWEMKNQTGMYHLWGGLGQNFKWNAPEKMEKVAEFDSKSTKVVDITLQGGDVHKNTWTPSDIKFIDADVPAVDVTPEEVPEVPTPEANTPTVEAPVVDTPTVDVTAPDVEVPAVETPETSQVTTPEPISEAKKLSANELVTWKPPPAPPHVEAGKTADPVLPAVTGASDLDAKPTSLSHARSMAEGAKAMLGQKDSTDAGSAYTYATGDSDYIEDMAVRFNVEKRTDGTERLVMRFRLREDNAEETVAKFVTTGEGKKGAWKLQGTKFAKQLTDGDLIAVYVSSQDGGPLKPSSTGQNPKDEPNAQIVGAPKLVGKSPKNPDRDLYRVSVITQGGALGEVDIEQREDGTILTFEYDHEAPVKSSYNTLKLTNTAASDGWTKTGPMTMPGSQGTVYLDDTGKVQWPGYDVGTLSKGSGGQHMQRVNPDGTAISFNSAHSTEGGTGFDTTRRANISGEVQISTPIGDGRPEEEIIKSLSIAMQQVGVPVDKQGAATDDQLLTYALSKMVTNWHPKYTYRGAPVQSVDDPRVNQTFEHMTNELQKELGRPVTLDDVRVHFFENGRMAVVWSPDVARAIGKKQGVHHYEHSGASGTKIFGGTASGLMSTDERWSLGVMTTGQSSFADMTIGSGDRVYMRPASGFHAGHVVLSPLAVNSNMDVYTMGHGDNYGRRGDTNKGLLKSSGWEYMLKRKVEPEQITFWIAGTESQRQDVLKQLADRGVTEVGGRPIADIVVTSEQAQKMDLDAIGAHQFSGDIPITQLVSAA